MKELEEIAAAYRLLAEPCALATVVRVEGSSYRQPGARMLVSGAGHIVAGCVSGGCLEADVAEHGLGVIASGEPRVLVYDTLTDGGPDGELLLGVGTGCEGVIEILLERLEGDSPIALTLPLDPERQEISQLLTTIYRRGGRPVAEHYSGTLRLAENVDAFQELIESPVHLLLCGAGPDSLPLARLALEILGWRVTVADHRAAYADASRYPAGVRIARTRPDALAGHVALDHRTAVILMTHNYLLDRELLAQVVRSDVFYVGVLGSRKRWQTLEDDLRSDGIDAPILLGGRLHAPVGLNIGASSPETIALSIAAEVQAALADHPGGAMHAAYAMPREIRMKETGRVAAYTTATTIHPGIKGDLPRCRIPLLLD